VTVLLALPLVAVLVLFLFLRLDRAVDLVLELDRGRLELALQLSRYLAGGNRVVGRALELVGEPGGAAFVARVECVGDRVAQPREVVCERARQARLFGRALVGAPTGRQREGRSQGDEGEQRPQVRNRTVSISYVRQPLTDSSQLGCLYVPKHPDPLQLRTRGDR
jgi:hypothetical protein